MNTTAKFLSTFFNSGQKSIDPATFNVNQFNDAQNASDAMSLLRFSVDSKNDEYIKSALNMIYRLYHQDNTKNIAVQFGDLGICPIIDSIFTQKTNDIQLSNHCLQVMYILIASPNAENPLTLTTQSQRKSSSEQSLSSSLLVGLPGSESIKALSTVVGASPSTDLSANRKRLSNSGTIFRIVKCGQVHINEVSLLLSVLKVLREFMHDIGTISRLVSCGVCDLLTQMLRQHTLNETILPIICELMYQLILSDLDDCGGSNHCQDKFAEFYVCEQLIIKILSNSARLTSLSIVWVLKAIGALSRRHEDNKKRFAAAETCSIIPKMSKELSMEDSLLAEAICWTIGNLAFPDEINQLQLGDQGSCAIILTILKAHSQNRIVVQEGMRALRNLCQSCDANIRRFIDLQGIAFCMELVRLFMKEPDVLQWIMYAIAAMCDCDAARSVFGEEGITEQIAGIFHQFATSSNEDIIQWTSLVAAQVAKDPELAAQLHDLNLCGNLIQAIVCHSKNPDVIEELLNVLTSLALVSERSRISFIESSVHDLLLKFLVDFEAVETTVEQTLIAFSAVLRLAQESMEMTQPSDSMLCRHSFQADDRSVSNVKLAKVYKLFVGGCCVQSNGLKLLAKVISKNYENEFIALHGVQSLAGLALGSFLIDRSDIVQSDRVLSVLRVGLFSNSRGMLGVLGDANVINTLCIITASHLTDTAIVKWSLYSLLQLCSVETNMEILRQSDICLIVSKLLEIYYISSEEEATNILILIFGLVVQLCVFPELRVQLGNFFTPGAGSGLPTHSLLTAIAHHLLSVDALRAGSEAMSALCISPLEDALSAVYRQEQSERRKSTGGSLGGRSSFTAMTMNLTGTPTTPSLNQPQSEGDTLDWINFPSAEKGDDGSTEASSVQTNEQTSGGEGVMTSTARNLFGFASFFKATNKEAAEVTETRDERSNSNAVDRKRATTISTIDSYNSLLPPPGVSGNNLLFEAASNIISTGLSDQEELLIAQKSNLKLKSRKSSGESLVENGAVALLVAAIQSHPLHEGVLCATLNTLNSLAVFPTNRQKFDDPLIYEVLISILTSFAREQLPSLARETVSKTDSSEEVTKDEHAISLPITPLKKPEVENDPSDRRLSTKSMQTHLEASRAVRILLLVVVGTICMPVADEELHQTNSKSHRKNLATNAYTFHEVNQEQFGNLGVFPVILDMLTAYTFDSLICEAALRAIYFLTKGNSQNQTRFSAVAVKVEGEDAEERSEESSEGVKGGRGIVLLVDILKQNQDKPRVIYYACLAIAAVAGSHSDNAAFLGERGICALVASILQQYLDKAEIVQACCQAISSLTFLNEQWNQHHVCELVLQALTAHSNSAVVAEWVCRAIGSLAEFKENKIELDNHHVAKTLTMALQKHVSADNLLFSAFTKDNSSPGVARWGCTAIFYLLDDGRILNDRKAVPQLQASMVAAGACEAVAKALVKYSEVETVSYACCRALVVLLMNNEAYKVKLGGLGVCSCVVESLHLFPASALVAEWGCRAAAVLAENNESNIAKLAVAGACETIPLVLQAHPHNEQVAIAGSDVISYMSVHLASGYAARFGHAGACEAVVSVLRKHTGNALVVASASIALAALARVPGNARWFGPAGGAEALHSAICLHKHDRNVAKYVANAVGNLCLVDHNKDRLGSIGVCEEIIEIANFHQRDLETAIATSGAMWKLCETIHKHKTAKAAASKEVLEEGGGRGGAVDDASKTASETSKEVNEAQHVRLQRIQQSLHYREGRHNRAVLLDSEVCQTLVQLLNFHLADATAAKTICHAISVLATPGTACAEERAQLGELGVCVAIVKALSFHEGMEDVSRWGCLAVRALCHQSPENQQRFHETQLPSLLVLNLRGFRQAVDLPDHQALMEAVLGAVINFASGHQNNKAVLGECGACEGLLELLDLHVRNQEIIYLTVKALFHICDGNQLNRMKISFSGAADFLMTCLTKYPDEDKLVDFVLGIMIGMSFDKVGQSKLGTVGMCKHVSQLIIKYEKASDYLTVLSVCLVGTLARNSKANQEKLALSQVHKLIIPLLQKAVTSTVSTATTTSPTNAATSAGFLTKTISSLRRNSILPPSSSSPPTSPDAAAIEALNSADVAVVAASESEESQSPNVSLSEYIGDFSLAKECCRALYHLTSDSEANRQRVNSSTTNNTNVIDTLTAILSSNNDEVFNEEVKVWAKKAMEALFTSAQA